VATRNFLFIYYKPFYVFVMRAIESSILFAVFRPLRTPIPNDQSSTYLSSLERLWPADGFKRNLSPEIQLWPAQIAKNIVEKGLSSNF
jgi:hypothetical protein